MSTPRPLGHPACGDRPADRFTRHLPALCLGALLAYSIGLLGWSSARLPFWYDELLTIRLSELTTVAELRRALAAGFDLNPPLLYLVTRAARVLPGPETLTARLPALAGFALLVVSLFLFLRRRVGSWFALAAVGLVALAPYTIQYAVEARSYMLLLGISACALVCWQTAAAAYGRSAPGQVGYAPRLAAGGLALSVAAALLLHVWAILLPAALLIGETVAFARTRRVRWWIVGALAAAAPVLGLYPDLLEASRSMVLATSVYEPSLQKLSRALNTLVPRHRVLAGTVVVACIAGWWLRRRAPGDRMPCRGLEPDEWAVLGALAVSPLLPYLYAHVAGSAFMDRYVFYTLPALITMLGAVLFHLGGGHARAGVAAAGVTLLGVFLYLPPKLPEGPSRTAAVDSLASMESRLDATLPIVPANPLDVLHLDQQARPSLRNRVLFVADPDLALALTGTNGVDIGYVRGEPFLNLRVQRVSYESLTRGYSRFYLVGKPHVLSWLPKRLTDDGWRLLEIGGTPMAPIFEVVAPQRDAR